MSTQPFTPGSRSIFVRLARAACPGPERPWLTALVAESSAIDAPGPRLRWLLGAWSLVLRANVRQALGTLKNHPVVAVALALVGWTLLASPSLLAYEVMNTEDDLFLLAATIFSGVLLGATALALLLDYGSHHVTQGGRP